MKKSLQKIQLGGVFAMLVLGFAFWTLLLQPQMNVPEMREAEAQSLRAQYNDVDARVLELMVVEANYAPQTEEAEALNVRVPQALEQYSFTEQMNALAAARGINALGIDVSITGSLAPVNNESLTGSDVYSVPVSIVVRSVSPGVLMEFANALHDAPRTVSINAMTVGVADEGGYEMSISGTIYAAPSLPTVPAPAPETVTG